MIISKFKFKKHFLCLPRCQIINNIACGIAAGLLLWSMIVGVAAAFITAPSSVSISNINIFRNLAETGDKLIVFRYSMPYDSDNYTSTPASESILLRCYGTDGTTVLVTAVPYVYPYFESNGYGDGVASFYFSASDNFTWSDNATIEIYGWPSYFGSGVFDNKSEVLTSSVYVTATTQDDNRELLKNYILLACDWLSSSYSDSGVILKGSSDMGIVLSSYGELYFRGAIPGLQTLCPELFFIQTLIPEAMTVTPYDMSLQTTLTNRLIDDDLGEGVEKMGVLVGMSGGVFAATATFIGSIVICIWTTRKGWGTEIGILLSTILLIVVALLIGDATFTLLMIAGLAAAMGVVWIFLLKKA